MNKKQGNHSIAFYFEYMVTTVSIEEFIKREDHYPLIDVRSPGEFEKGHIANAVNIPLFTNEERAVIGTLYKRKGK